MASQGLTRLHEGVPQQGTVGGKTSASQYYEFYNPVGNGEPVEVRSALARSLAFFSLLPQLCYIFLSFFFVIFFVLFL